MLPDYPLLKNKLYKMYLNRMRLVQQGYSFPLNKISKKMYFEGDNSFLIHENGKREQIKPKKYSSEFSLDLSNLTNISPQELVNQLDEIAIDLAKQQSLELYKEVEKSAESVGNVVNAKGEFTIDTFLDMLEKIQLEFNEKDETPYFPTIVAGKQGFDAITQAFPQLDTNKKYKKRFEKIINKKKEEWIARENNRKLVG